jgi:hypothetical protein
MSDPYNPGQQFTLSSPYGKRRDPKTGKDGEFHSGQDFAQEKEPRSLQQWLELLFTPVSTKIWAIRLL